MEKLEIFLTPELMKRIDKLVELLDFNSRGELAYCSILKFLDKYPSSETKAC